ncbi:MAG TPA: hypothetical protein VE988_11345 [Gemmataceae bacterium]|nr:hypothetical protein [Gemmataceae bacterium]
MLDPRTLTHVQLATIVTEVQKILWQGFKPIPDFPREYGDYWNPVKEDDGDALEQIADVMADAHLMPPDLMPVDLAVLAAPPKVLDAIELLWAARILNSLVRVHRNVVLKRRRAALCPRFSHFLEGSRMATVCLHCGACQSRSMILSFMNAANSQEELKERFRRLLRIGLDMEKRPAGESAKAPAVATGSAAAHQDRGRRPSPNEWAENRSPAQSMASLSGMSLSSASRSLPVSTRLFGLWMIGLSIAVALRLSLSEMNWLRHGTQRQHNNLAPCGC